MEHNIIPEMKILDPRRYLADRVKRGMAFVAVLSELGKFSEPMTSNHIKRLPEPAETGAEAMLSLPGQLGGVAINYRAEASDY